MTAKILIKRTLPFIPRNVRLFSECKMLMANHTCKLLVVGGGTGGCTIAAKFARQLKQDEIIVVDPAVKHYYQPMFTMIGGGMKTLEQSSKPMDKVLPTKAKWIKSSVQKFSPTINTIETSNGDIIKYDYMIVGTGLQLNYEKIPGLLESLSTESSGVCSNYSPLYVQKTYKTLQEFKSGNAIFTFPNSPVKCPGAPQKILYITEHYFRKQGKRDKANLIYNTSLPVIFGVKKYADALWIIAKTRNIQVNTRTNLIEVKPKEKIAVFENLDKPEEKKELEYSMLHVTPPMSTTAPLKECKELVNEAGFVDVHKETLQSTKFSNVFAIGDCSNSPNSKTAASIAAQSSIIHNNLNAVMNGKKPKEIYDGYASCPLVTGYDSCIMAEFDYNLTPKETFPFDQSKERYSMFIMKKDFMPALYWNGMLNGYWNGPEMVRKIMHFGTK